MNIISILNRFGQLIWVGAFQINIDLNYIAQIPLFIKNFLLDVRELADQVLKAITDSIPFNLDYI